MKTNFKEQAKLFWEKNRTAFVVGIVSVIAGAAIISAVYHKGYDNGYLAHCENGTTFINDLCDFYNPDLRAEYDRAVEAYTSRERGENIYEHYILGNP